MIFRNVTITENTIIPDPIIATVSILLGFRRHRAVHDWSVKTSTGDKVFNFTLTSLVRASTRTGYFGIGFNAGNSSTSPRICSFSKLTSCQEQYIGMQNFLCTCHRTETSSMPRTVDLPVAEDSCLQRSTVVGALCTHGINFILLLDHQNLSISNFKDLQPEYTKST